MKKTIQVVMDIKMGSDLDEKVMYDILKRLVFPLLTKREERTKNNKLNISVTEIGKTNTKLSI